MSPLTPSGSLDLNFLRKKEALSRAEREIMSIAGCHQKDILEIEDFYVGTNCSPPTLERPISKKGASNKFESYRKSVITTLLQERLKPIIEISPKFDIELLTDFFVKYTRGVTNMSEMLDQLVPFLRGQDQYNNNGLMILAFTWTLLYNLKEVHRNWTVQGGTPILPGNEVDALIGLLMEELGAKRLKLGAITENNTEWMQAAYEANSHMIVLHLEVLANPRILLNDKDTSLDRRLLHELHHAYQALTVKEKITRARFETETYIFESKVGILMRGYQNTKKTEETAKIRLEKKLKRTIDGWVKARSESTLDAAVADFYEALYKERDASMTDLRVDFIELAQNELKNRVSNKADRQKLETAYIKNHLWQLMSMCMATLFQDYGSQEKNYQKKFEDLDLPLTLPPLKAASSAGTDKEETTLVDYLWRATEQYFLIHTVIGSADAKKFLREQYFPKLFNGPFFKSFMEAKQSF